MNNISEMKHWHSDVKGTVGFFTNAPSQTRELRKIANELNVIFVTFKNPPEVRFAEHLHDMCTSVFKNLPALRVFWIQMKGQGERCVRQCYCFFENVGYDVDDIQTVVSADRYTRRIETNAERLPTRRYYSDGIATATNEVLIQNKSHGDQSLPWWR